MTKIAPLAVVVAVGLIVPTLVAADRDIGPLLETIRAVGPRGTGHGDAIAALQELSQADANQITDVLGAMDGAGKLAINWLRAAVEAIADRQRRAGSELPVAALQHFLLDTSHAPRARRLAYELIRAVDAKSAEEMLPGFLNDPSLELRRDAVVVALKAAEKLKQRDNAAAITAYRQALSAARDLDQIQSAAESLSKLGETIDLSTHFGFVTRWHLIAPFDNTDKSGFDMAYPPERDVDLIAVYKGHAAELPDAANVSTVTWMQHATSDDYGRVDLNEVLGGFKGAVAYAYAEFVSDADQDAELRLGTANGNKIWLNGELLSSNHVYHARKALDQYVGQGQLRKGRNTILLKICQNEQTESWAQVWDFQLRVCDQYGTAILSEDR